MNVLVVRIPVSIAPGGFGLAFIATLRHDR